MPGGERTNLAQYIAAIDTARSSIYLEHQQIDVGSICDALTRAAQRGVEILALLPVECSEALQAIRGYGNVTLARVAGLGADGRRKPAEFRAGAGDELLRAST